MAMDNGPAGTPKPEPSRASADMHLMRSLMIGIFLFALVYGLYFGRDFFMPVVLAFMLALMLTPIVRFLRNRGIPEPVSATMLVFVTFIFLGAVGYFISGPVIALANDLPSIGRRLSDRLTELKHPFERLLEILQQVDHAADTASEPGLQRVVVSQPGVISQAAGNLLSAGTSIAITIVLSLFLLASGSMFYEKIVQSFARMSEKKRALRVVYDVEREISRYLLTVTLINSGLGVVIGLGMWAVGMPTPLVWGVVATLLNFLPYIGAAISIISVTTISVISFDSLAYASIAPAFLMLVYVLEGQVVTPLIVGRRLEINAVAIFIAVAFWSWLWGFIGALLAVPLLVVIKVFCDHFDSLRHVGNFLAAQQTTEEAESEPQVKAGAP